MKTRALTKGTEPLAGYEVPFVHLLLHTVWEINAFMPNEIPILWTSPFVK